MQINIRNYYTCIYIETRTIFYASVSHIIVYKFDAQNIGNNIIIIFIFEKSATSAASVTTYNFVRTYSNITNLGRLIIFNLIFFFFLLKLGLRRVVKEFNSPTGFFMYAFYFNYVILIHYTHFAKSKRRYII